MHNHVCLLASLSSGAALGASSEAQQLLQGPHGPRSQNNFLSGALLGQLADPLPYLSGLVLKVAAIPMDPGTLAALTISKGRGYVPFTLWPQL